MASRLRVALVVFLAIALSLIAFTSIPARIATRVELATALIGTFFLFPSSKIHTIAIDDVRARVEGPRVGSPQSNRLPVPAIVHQVQLGGLQMKPTWITARKACLDLHPDWEFKLWRDADGDAFVKEHHPDLFETYRGYGLEIQRSNVLRYLVLNHYGGMYMDLDLRCRVPLDGLRNESFLTPPANPTGVNNAFIASSPKHPFWSEHLIPHLQRYDLHWFGSPYITNMMSTGCHFFSTMHRTFAKQQELGILDAPNKLNGHVTTPLFEHLGASSWHKGDAKAILQMGKAVEAIKKRPVASSAVGLGAIILIIAFLALLILAIRRLRRPASLRHRKRTSDGYVDIESSKAMVESHT